MKTQRTYAEIANNFRLWQEFVDTGATMTEAEFDALTLDQKVAMQVDAFGPEIARATFSEGDRVESGEGKDHDTGRVESVAGETAIVAWDSGVKTPAAVSRLRAL